ARPDTREAKARLQRLRANLRPKKRGQLRHSGAVAYWPACDVLRVRLVGAGKSVTLTGKQKQKGVSNYLVGKDPSRWHKGVPMFGRVRAEGALPRVTIDYY